METIDKNWNEYLRVSDLLRKSKEINKILKRNNEDTTRNDKILNDLKGINKTVFNNYKKSVLKYLAVNKPIIRDTYVSGYSQKANKSENYEVTSNGIIIEDKEYKVSKNCKLHFTDGTYNEYKAFV